MGREEHFDMLGVFPDQPGLLRFLADLAQARGVETLPRRIDRVSLAGRKTRGLTSPSVVPVVSEGIGKTSLFEEG